MRVKICQEGIEEVPGHIILPGALQWEDKKYPITWNNSLSDIVGFASDIQRDKDNVISVDIDEATLDSRLKTLFADVGTTIFANQLVEKKEKGKREIVSATIRSLYCTLDVPWRNPSVEENDGT